MFNENVIDIILIRIKSATLILVCLTDWIMKTWEKDKNYEISFKLFERTRRNVEVE
jgi:hypothetical protein